MEGADSIISLLVWRGVPNWILRFGWVGVRAGYATNPRYADMLIKLIEEHDLSSFDAGGRNIPVIPGSTPAPVAVKPKEQPHHKTPKTPHEHSKAVDTDVLITTHDVPYIISAPGDSWLSVAMAHDMRLWQVLSYNDASQNDQLQPGDPVYLKPKRGKPQQEFHVVQGEENLWQISQKYCVKMKKLIKLNDFSESVALEPGEKIKLR